MSLLFLIFFFIFVSYSTGNNNMFWTNEFFFCHLIIRYLLYHINRLSVVFFLKSSIFWWKGRGQFDFCFVYLFISCPPILGAGNGEQPPPPPPPSIPSRCDRTLTTEKKPQPKFWVTSKIIRWNKFRKDAFPNISTITHVYIHLDYEGCNLYKLKV